MTKNQLIDKWATRGVDAAMHDQGMTPCYDEEVEHGHDDVLYTHREGWESTSHFHILYGDKMYCDALEFFVSLGCLGKYPSTEDIIDLKTDFLEAFWDAWEDEVGAYDLIEKALAGRMFGLLEVAGDDVLFTDEARSRGSVEFSAMVRWMNGNRSATTFLLDQAYYMLDHVSNEGLENIESDYPEPDIYTEDLVAWLAQTTRNLTYVTEALREGGNSIADGTDLLQRAQYMAIRDAWASLAKVLKGLLE